MAMASGLPPVAVQAAMWRRETEDGATPGLHVPACPGVCNAGTAAPAQLAG
jgi:hypothetical protein